MALFDYKILYSKLVAFLGLFFLAGTVVAEDTRPTINWLSIDVTPMWIHEGALKGQGYVQGVEKLLQDRLPQYAHKNEPVVYMRTIDILKNRDACFAGSSYQGGSLLDSQKKGIIWSAPTTPYFYQGVIARRNSKASFLKHQPNPDGVINLASLFADPNLKGSYEPNRVYSLPLDKILRENAHVKNLLHRPGRFKLTERIFALLDARRIDYFIDYAFKVRFHEENTDQPNQYVYFPIDTHRGMFGLLSIACSDTPFGRKLINEFNEILTSLRPTREYQEINSRWLMPEGQANQFWKLWETEVLSRHK